MHISSLYIVKSIKKKSSARVLKDLKQGSIILIGTMIHRRYGKQPLFTIVDVETNKSTTKTMTEMVNALEPFELEKIG